MDGLGAPFDVEPQAGLFQLLLYRGDEGINVFVARSFSLVQLLLDMVIYVVLGILQGEVFQLRLQLIEAQLMRQGGIQIDRFVGHLPAGFVVVRILDLSHHVDTVGNHDEDDAHVLGKGKQQVAEILGFDGRTFGIEVVDPNQAADDAGYVFTKVRLHLLGGTGAASHGVVQHQSEDGCPSHTNLFGYDDGCLHILDDRVQTEQIPLYAVVLYGVDEIGLQLLAISLLQCFARKLKQFPIQRKE